MKPRTKVLSPKQRGLACLLLAQGKMPDKEIAAFIGSTNGALSKAKKDVRFTCEVERVSGFLAGLDARREIESKKASRIEIPADSQHTSET